MGRLSSWLPASRLCFMRQKKARRAPVDKWDALTGLSAWTWDPAAHRQTQTIVRIRTQCSSSARLNSISFSLISYLNLSKQTWWRDLLVASMRRWRGCSSADDSCSFTLLMSLGWMKSNRLCPVSSNCESNDTRILTHLAIISILPNCPYLRHTSRFALILPPFSYMMCCLLCFILTVSKVDLEDMEIPPFVHINKCGYYSVYFNEKIASTLWE